MASQPCVACLNDLAFTNERSFGYVVKPSTPVPHLGADHPPERPFRPRSLGTTKRGHYTSVTRAEDLKHRKYDANCAATGSHFSPFALETTGGHGPLPRRYTSSWPSNCATRVYRRTCSWAAARRTGSGSSLARRRAPAPDATREPISAPVSIARRSLVGSPTRPAPDATVGLLGRVQRESVLEARQCSKPI